MKRETLQVIICSPCGRRRGEIVFLDGRPHRITENQGDDTFLVRPIGGAEALLANIARNLRAAGWRIRDWLAILTGR